MKAYINQILDMPTSDPDEARRGRLLNILLLGMFIAAIVGLIFIVLNAIISNIALSDPDIQILLVGIGIFISGILVIYQINRRLSGRWAALIFLLLLTFIFVLTDSPRELVIGRSLFLFTLPMEI